MNDPLPGALRRHFRRHNVQAFGLAGASLLGAALFGGLLVLAIYWFALLGATINRASNPERSLDIFDARDLVGPWFWQALSVGAASLVVLSAAARRGRWADRCRDSRFYLAWALVELLLIAPDALFASWGNLQAMVWLGSADQRLAFALLQAVGRRQRRNEPLPLAGAAAEIGATVHSLPGLNRALFALQVTGLVTLREGGAEGWQLRLSGEEAHALCGGDPTMGPKTSPG